MHAMDPLLVAANAADTAALGVRLAQDLYRLASAHPGVECQIGRVAQAFVDLNLALADLAAALPPAQEAVTFSQPCLSYLAALVDRIAAVQKTFRSTLNDGVAADGSSSSSSKKQAKSSVSKLARLKTVFPGSGAAERFTEMEWMRNTLALIASVARLSTAQAQVELSPSGSADQESRVAKLAGLRIASETLTSAVAIYVRTIEQKLASPNDDDDDSDDEEPITGPGCLLFTATLAQAAPKQNATKKSVLFSLDKQPAMPKLDAANWIYEALRDKIKECGRADQLPSQFVDWLVQEAVASAKLPVQPVDQTGEQTTEQPNASKDEAEPNADEGPASKQIGPELAAAPASSPLLSRKAAKKKGKNKGKGNAVASTPVDPEPTPNETEVDHATAAPPDTAETEDGKAQTATATDGAQSSGAKKTHAGGTDVALKEGETPGGTAPAPAPEAPAVGDHAGSPKPPPRHADAERSRDSKFGGRFDASHDHDDLPPPYPSPDAFAPPGRGAPFANPHFPFQSTNAMAYPPAPAGYDDYSNMAYMHARPAMFPSVGFYPMHSPYISSQPFYGGRPGGPLGGPPGGPDAYNFNEFYDGQYRSRSYSGMRRHSTERPLREGQNSSGPLVPRRRPDAADENLDEHPGDDLPRSRRHSPPARNRRETSRSHPGNDKKESETPSTDADKSAGAGKTSSPDTKGKQADPSAKEKEDDGALDKEGGKGKKRTPFSKQTGKSGSSSKEPVPGAKDEDKNDSESEAETVDMRGPAPAAMSNTGKKRNAKNNTEIGKRASRQGKAASPSPVSHMPTPPTPPSATDNGENDDAAQVKSKDMRAEKAQINAGVEDHDEEQMPRGNQKKAKRNSSDSESDADSDDDRDDHDNETRFSPETEPRVFTPPPTPPDAPHLGEASDQPHAPAPGLPGDDGGDYAHNSGPGRMPYYPQMAFMPQQYPMPSTNPFFPRRGGSNDGAGFAMNMDGGPGLGMGMGMGYGFATGAAPVGGFDPAGAFPWTGAPMHAAAAAAAAAGMNGPVGPQPGFLPSWMRRKESSAPARGPPPPPGPPPRASSRWGRYRGRAGYGEYDEEADDGFGHGDYDDEEHEEDERFRRGRGSRRSYRHRSYSPQYDRPSAPPLGPRGGAAGGGRGGGPPPPLQQSQQHQQHQQHQQQHHPYYDRPPRALYDDEAGQAWGWPGDTKQRPVPPPVPPPAAEYAPAQHGGGGGPPHYGWDDVDHSWMEAYRQGRGHAEYEMTELDG